MNDDDIDHHNVPFSAHVRRP